MAHTPGKWEIKQTTHLFGDGTPVFQIVSKTNYAGNTRADDGWYIIAELVGLGDAELMRAAPDLYAELVSIVDQIRNGVPSDRINIDGATAAIAKAKGEA